MAFAPGPPLTDTAVRLVLLGSGELGREVAVEAVRLGCEVLAVDRYAGAPAMQVAHRHAVVDMTDPVALRALLDAERANPCAELLVVPELEAIATAELVALEAEGLHVVPTARAARLTMDREGIRRLVAEELGLPTSAYRFCDSEAEVAAAVEALGTPCVIKPVMSSSGKGQSVIRSADDVARTWAYAQEAGRVGAGRVIVEAFVEFDYEITLLTVRHAGGTSFCDPIGHVQEDGDYRESWQPHPMSDAALTASRELATAVTTALGGTGIFGVELFVVGDEVLFSEVSPRPHDTGMVTMTTQALSEFALHVRAILGLPVPAGTVPLLAAGASAVCLATTEGRAPRVVGVDGAMAVDPSVDVRVFAKPDARPNRRMAVALAKGPDAESARATARAAAAQLAVE
ncbi:phosphoribosylglycinamide formyltransferase 2 [Marmoricola sp. OAE513]|uniref:formate-dependent phosphoribosylglycinamide formyltransferase n=1 Tax=Marmoricola sp. OAE513 TaxID=2817894 RepID=UPI001AE68CFA